MNKIKSALGRVVVFCGLVALLGVVTGCRNTAHGVGKDVEKAGEKIQDKTQ